MSTPEAAVAAVLVLWACAGHRRRLVSIGLATIGALGTVGLVVAGRWRWQLVPLTVVVGVVVLATLVRASDRAPDDLWRRGTTLVVAAGVTLTVVAALLLPVPTMRLEDGAAPVGTVAFDLEDPTRSSPSTTAPVGHPRGITVQAWWPTDVTTGERQEVAVDAHAFAAAAGDFLGLPPLMLGHLGVAETTAFVDAPPATTDRLPVIVSLHGWGGFRFAQAPLLEQLASDGHIVLAIDHTHGALAAQPVSGSVVPIDQQLLPDDAPEDVYDAASTVLEDTFRGDAESLVDALRHGDSAVPQTVLELVDLDRLVVMGHSTGGGAAVWWCSEDAACDGVLTFDPWVEPLATAQREAPPDVPWLSVLSAAWIGNENDGVLRPMVERAGRAELVAIEHTEHRDVTVQPLLSPLTSVLGLAGDLDKDRVDAIALDLSRGFLDDVFGDGDSDGTVNVASLPADVIRP